MDEVALIGHRNIEVCNNIHISLDIGRTFLATVHEPPKETSCLHRRPQPTQHRRTQWLLSARPPFHSI